MTNIIDITKQGFANDKGITVLFNDVTGYITVEAADIDMILEVYDDGNWDMIKDMINDAIANY